MKANPGHFTERNRMAKKAALPEMAIHIHKIATCPTLSGRSQLTYHVGNDTELALHIRVVQNSGNGQFNSNWVSLSEIEKLLTAHPADKPMTSSSMLPVFRSKSSNSPAFLFATLLAEGLVTAGKEKDSGYLLGNIEAFKKEMSALIAAGTDLSAPADKSPEPSGKKRPGKGAE
jgi:hypothetical protein